MKKLSVKEQLNEANHTISRIFYETYKIIGDVKILELILSVYNEDLYDLDKDIERERNYANENKTGAYISAGKDARVRVKYLQKARKELLTQIKLTNSLIKQKSKTDKMW